MSRHSNGVIDPQLDNKPVYIEHAGASHARGGAGRFGVCIIFVTSATAGSWPKRIIGTNAPVASCNLVTKKTELFAPERRDSFRSSGLIAVHAKSCLGYCGRIHHRSQEVIAHCLNAGSTALQVIYCPI